MLIIVTKWVVHRYVVCSFCHHNDICIFLSLYIYIYIYVCDMSYIFVLKTIWQAILRKYSRTCGIDMSRECLPDDMYLDFAISVYCHAQMYFAHFQMAFLERKPLYQMQISLKCIPMDQIDIISALFQIMAWCQTGNDPLSQWGPNSPTHICIPYQASLSQIFVYCGNSALGRTCFMSPLDEYQVVLVVQQSTKTELNLDIFLG